MSVRIHTDIDNLAAPAADGAVLIWPDAATILRMAGPGSTRGESRLDIEKAEVIAGAARTGGPLILTGHQPEFLHPGVWVKTVIAFALARRLGGRAAFLLVDSDVSEGVPLAWPELVQGEWRKTTRGTFVTGRAEPFEALVGMGDCERVFSTAEQALNSCGVWGTVPNSWTAFKDAFLGRTEAGSVDSYVNRWLRGMWAIADSFGLPRLDIIRVSEFFGGETKPVASFAGTSAMDFAACLILNASRFHAAYNQALHVYREARGIRGDRHPVPDLAREGDRFELPFWLWRAGEVRRRMSVAAGRGESISFWADEHEIGQFHRNELVDGPTATLRAAMGPWRVRPRALALTMYARLFLCDHFVHGIGGAKYDQITDDVIRSFFKVEPPAFSCATATLHLPLGGEPMANNTNEPAGRLRDVRFNPQRYLEHDAPTSVLALIRERDGAIANSAQLHDQTPADRAARKAAYERIQRLNEAIHAAQPGLLQDAEQREQDALRDAAAARIARDREWFVGLYPAEKLRALAAAVDAQIAGRS